MKPKSKLLRKKSAVTPDVVKIEVFVHDGQVIADVHEALSAGLVPMTFALINNSVVLTLEREKS